MLEPKPGDPPPQDPNNPQGLKDQSSQQSADQKPGSDVASDLPEEETPAKE
jgi:hypothetical protein